MTSARSLPILAIALLAGCGLLEEDEPGTPPPVGESASVGMMTQGGGGSGGLTTGGEQDTGSTGSSSSDGADTTGPPLPDLGMDVLFTGELGVGDGAWALPLSCSIRFFFAEQINPMTGVAMEWEADIPLVIEAFPQPYMVTRDDVPKTIDVGATGYVGLRCDLDEDGVFDNVGGYFPGLPAELVVLPAPDVDIEVVFL